MKAKNFVVLLLFLVLSVIGSWILFTTEGWVKLALVIGIYALLFVFINLLHLAPDELGIEKKNVLPSIKATLPFVGLTVAVMSIAFFISPDSFLDERYNTSFTGLLLNVLLLLPFKTVILEELYFRGIVLGYSLRVMSMRVAVVVSSVLFGIWHVFSARGLSTDQVGVEFSGQSIILPIGVVIITSVAGMLLALFRLRTKSLISPILLHWTINATGMILAYFAWR